MAEIISKEIKDAIANPKSLKSIGTVDKNGLPHVVYKGSLHLDENDNIVFYDLLESSKVNENLVYAIWFDKYAVVNVLTEDKKSYEILVKPKQSVTAGREFEEVYKKLLERRPDGDLNAIWILEPLSVREETFDVRFAEQKDKHPILGHLDKFV